MNIFQDFIFKGFLLFCFFPFILYFLPKNNEKNKNIFYLTFYGILLIFLCYYASTLMKYQKVILNMFTFIKDINFSMAIEAFSLVFLLSIVVTAIFLSISMYIYFKEVKDMEGYNFYSRIAGIIFTFIILSSLSNNLVTIFFLDYMAFFAAWFCFSFYYNEDKITNSTIFSVASLSFLTLFIIVSYIYNVEGVGSLELFTIRERIKSVQMENSSLILYLYILASFPLFIMPIQFALKNFQYREPVTIMFGLILPGMFLSLFTVFRTIYYLFANNFTEILYTNDVKYFIILCLSINYYYIIKDVKNITNTIFFFIINNFLSILLFLFLVHTEYDFFVLFAHLIIFIIAVAAIFMSLDSTSMLLYNISSETLLGLYHKSKIEVILLILSMFFLFLTNLSLLFKNLSYLLNFSEYLEGALMLIFIVISLLLSGVCSIISLKTMFYQESVGVDQNLLLNYITIKQFKIILPTIIMLILFLILFAFKGLIITFLTTAFA